MAVDIPRKREVLKFVASIYDPFELINPVVVKLKVLFQRVSLSRMGWEDYFYGKNLAEWQSILNDFLSSSSVMVPRWYLNSSNFLHNYKLVLLGFSGASSKEYGYCIYIRIFDKTHSCSTLIAPKSRIVSLTKTTMPRLELSANLLLAILMINVEKDLESLYNISRVISWTDSTICQHWINNSAKKYELFVQNRLLKFRELYGIESWKYVETELNPADIVSRGSALNNFKDNYF